MPYHYQSTPKIKQLSQQLTNHQFFIKNVPVNPERQQYLRQQTRLQSSLFSARIEGNQLTLGQIESGILEPKTRAKIEINNLLQALNLVFSTSAPQKLSLTFVQKLHRLTLKGLTTEAGRLRTEVTAIFNQAGVAVYLTPPPEEMEAQLAQLIQTNRTNTDSFFVSAIINHFWFEKIHPFVDGNGRVGRLLLQYWLDRGGEKFQGLLNFEEQIEATRHDYYALLQQESTDLTGFIEYMLNCLVTAGQQITEELKNQPREVKAEDLLLPRRREIVLLLRDHHCLSFDQIRRRFFGIKTATLHYDLRQLIRQGLVIKIGTTRGALYQPSYN